MSSNHNKQCIKCGVHDKHNVVYHGRTVETLNTVGSGIQPIAQGGSTEFLTLTCTTCGYQHVVATDNSAHKDEGMFK